MRKIQYIIFLLVTIVQVSHACDTCGCASSGGSLGYSTELNKNFLGVRYIAQQYRSKDGIFNNSPWVEENFNTLQAWGNFPLFKRFKISVIVPFQFHNRQFEDGTSQEISGVGDINLVAFYNVIPVLPDTIIAIRAEHYLQVGGGVKMPTGSYKKENNSGSVNPSFQVGSGSWDYILAATYGVNYQKWGISALANYTIKTVNSQEYQFGNQLNFGVNTFRTFDVSKNIAMTPIVGFAAEYFDKNIAYGYTLPNTDGEVYLGKLSVETTYDRFSLGLLGMLPISQNLNNGDVVLDNRISLYFNVNF